MSSSSKLNPWRGCGNLQFIASWSEAQVTTWTWCLKCGQYCGTKTFTCRIWCYLQVNSVRSEWKCKTHSWCPRIAWWFEKRHTSYLLLIHFYCFITIQCSNIEYWFIYSPICGLLWNLLFKLIIQHSFCSYAFPWSIYARVSLGYIFKSEITDH